MSTEHVNALPLTDPLDVLYADIAMRIQLSRTNHNLAVERYGAISDWIERPDNPLHELVSLLYPQGSMSIGSTISSKLKNDEFDLDIVAELLLGAGATPSEVLDILYLAIKGEEGSRYYNMTKRNSRCVTVYYAGGMHLDITPAIRMPEQPERISHIFHSKPEDPTEPDKKIIANPYGFSEWYKIQTPPDQHFALAFAERAGRYERGTILLEAQSEDIPDPDPFYQKSAVTVAQQLVKRWRNVKYDARSGRQPPSVMLAKLMGDSKLGNGRLAAELNFQVDKLLNQFEACHAQDRLIIVTNPACSVDVFSDRWPANLTEQKVFLDDLTDFATKLARLSSGIDLNEMKKILSELFGENPSHQVIADFNEQLGERIDTGRSRYNPANGKIDLVASGIVAAPSVVIASNTSRQSQPHNFYGKQK